MALKDTLLGLKIVEDNEYLDKYCKLIENNLNTKREKFKTQGHHFIPVYYYKYTYNIKTREESKIIANKDPNNIVVNLLYKDHVKAHYYLALCVLDNNFKAAMTFAFRYLLQNKFSICLIEDIIEDSLLWDNLQNLYSITKYSLYKEIGQRAKGRIAVYKDNCQYYIQPEELDSKLNDGYIQGLLPSTSEKIKSTCKHKIWITDGTTDIYINDTDVIPDNFYRGRSINYFQSNKTEKSELRRRSKIAKKHTGKKLSNETKQKLSNINKYGDKCASLRKWINNGEINKRVLQQELNEYLNNGWQLGTLKNYKSCSIERKEKISNQNKGRKYIHKDRVRKFVKQNELDEYLNDGWLLGYKFEREDIDG